MNKEELIRTLAAHAADAVVLLEKIWPDNDAFPTKLCDRVDASDYFITNRGAVIASDLRVPFLAEQVGAVGISSADVHTRWKIVAIYQSDIRFTYAVRTTAWDKKPRFPGLDLSDREVDIVYEMCDTLSRNRAYIEKDFFDGKDTFCRYSQQHARCQVARCFRRIPIHRAAAERPACPAGSRGCTARRCVERIDTGKIGRASCRERV